MTPIRIATRRSRLALAQSTLIGEQLASLSARPFELVEVTTTGDVDARPVESIGATGVFVAAVREAVRDGRADIAVHSLKDLPTAPAPGLTLAAVPLRADPRDALCAGAGRTFAQLPAGARVATGSPRRVAQLRALRSDLEYVGIRGNVDTRLRLVAQGSVDAVVLAMAGLVRLASTDAVTQVFPIEQCMPAPAQGALAVEVAADLDDPGLLAALETLDDPSTRAAATAERALLAALEAGCTAPVGAYAVVSGDEIHLTAVVADLSGAAVLAMSEKGAAAAAGRCGEILAHRLLAAGAAERVGEPIP